MTRVVDRLARSVSLAIIGVIAVALAAATLNSAVSPTSGGAIGLNGTGSSGGLLPAADNPVPPAFPSIPTVVLSAVGAILVIAVLWYALVYRYEALRYALAIALVVGTLGVILVGLLNYFGSTGGTFAGNGSAAGTSAGGGFSAGGSSPDLLSLPVLAVIGVVLVAAAFLLARGAGWTADGDDPDTADVDPTTAEAVGQVAGRMADRIEASATVDNEVYRAWREMTDLLDVPDPETSTPGEFANAAVAAGMDAADVDELTRLFETVRYGGVEPDETDEHRAVRVFRRIESSYAGSDDA